MTSTRRQTDELLHGLAKQLGEFDDQELQREIAAIQADVAILNRLIQERIVVTQLRQFAIQRAHEPINGAGGDGRWDLDTDIARAIDQIEEAVARVDEQAVQAELGRLQGEIQGLNRQINERQSTLNLKNALLQPHLMTPPFVVPNMVSGVSFAVGAIGGAAVPTTTTAAGRRVNTETKRQAIVELLREDPSREWTPAQIRKVLGSRGFTNPDEGTPVRALVWKLAKDRLITRVGQGRYALAPTVAAAEVPSDADVVEASDRAATEPETSART